MLWVPVAAGITGSYARERGLNVRYYRTLGALYSVHLLFPWLFFISRMSSGTPIAKMPIWTYFVSYGLWFMGPVMLAICIAAGYTWEHTIGGDYSPGDHYKLAVWRFLLANVPVMLVALGVSAVSTYHFRNADDEAERMFPDRLTTAVVCSVFAIPFMVGIGISGLEVSFPLMFAIGIPALCIAAGWFFMVGRVHQHGGYANVVAVTGDLLPRGYLGPFVYSFMWGQWVLWTGIMSWAMYGGDA